MKQSTKIIIQSAIRANKGILSAVEKYVESQPVEKSNNTPQETALLNQVYRSLNALLLVLKDHIKG